MFVFLCFHAAWLQFGLYLQVSRETQSREEQGVWGKWRRETVTAFLSCWKHKHSSANSKLMCYFLSCGFMHEMLADGVLQQGGEIDKWGVKKNKKNTRHARFSQDGVNYCTISPFFVESSCINSFHSTECETSLNRRTDGHVCTLIRACACSIRNYQTPKTCHQFFVLFFSYSLIWPPFGFCSAAKPEFPVSLPFCVLWPAPPHTSEPPL